MSDSVCRYPSETAHILSLLGVRPDGLTERPNGLHWNPFRVRTEFWSYLNYCISSERVAESSGWLADNEHRPDVMPSYLDGDTETSQSVSISENILFVEYWLTERPDNMALTSGRRQCLSVGHCRASGRKVLVVRTDVANWWASGWEHHIVLTVSWDPTSLSWNLHIIFIEHWNSLREACDTCNLS
jgi:hypothetical protein